MENFKFNKLEESKLEALVGGTEIISEESEFLIDELDFIIEDEPDGI